MRKDLPRHLAVTATALIPAVYLLVKWEAIPETVPLHFNGNFEPDRYGPKNELWLVYGIIAGASLGTYALLENLDKIDPKRRGRPLPSSFHRLSTGITMFLSALCLLVILMSTGPVHQMDRFLLPMLGFLFAFLGNIMYSIKPNYFAGVRVPWTLNSDENWRLTHRFTGKLWFICGSLLTISSFFLPVGRFELVLLFFLLPMVFLPIIYSFKIYLSEKNKKSQQQ